MLALFCIRTSQGASTPSAASTELTVLHMYGSSKAIAGLNVSCLIVIGLYSACRTLGYQRMDVNCREVQFGITNNEGCFDVVDGIRWWQAWP